MDDVELASPSPPNEPEKPKRALLSGGCAHSIAALRRSVGRLTSSSAAAAAQAQGGDQPSYLEEGVTAAEKLNTSGQAYNIHEGSGEGAKGDVGCGTDAVEPPDYVEKDGVGHCKDPENPCRSDDVPHVCVRLSSVGFDDAIQKTEYGKAV